MSTASVLLSTQDLVVGIRIGGYARCKVRLADKEGDRFDVIVDVDFGPVCVHAREYWRELCQTLALHLHSGLS